MATFHSLLVIALFSIACSMLFNNATAATSIGVTKHYEFNIKMQNVTRLCHTKSIVTVNGKFPGPRIDAREGDRLVIKVINHVPNNITLHWHGIRQIRSGWADGPAYIAQCPIQTGQSYVYNFTIVGQRGTLWWHAHISWLRSTLYGPIIIHPKRGVPYPFPKPYKEVPLVFGEWWNADTEAVINEALKTGGDPNVSDAYTINGHPGLLYNCSAKDTFRLSVKPGKTYLLRLVNAALNEELFFSIANHTLTTVEVDAVYVKPFETDTIIITPGQTTNVLLKTKPNNPGATFLMMARPYTTMMATMMARPSTTMAPPTMMPPTMPPTMEPPTMMPPTMPPTTMPPTMPPTMMPTMMTFDETTVAGILEYQHPKLATSIKKLPLFKPTLPVIDDTSFVANFTNKLRSLANVQYPANVPKKVDRHFFFTVGMGTKPCPKNHTCQGPTNSTMYAAAVNNVSFVMPKTAILESHYQRQSNGIFTPSFPTSPLIPFNYTGTPPNNTNVIDGTRVVSIPFNTSVELVMQGTSILGAESHPLHLHGYNFFVVGQGFGNFDPNKDPVKYNLVDPVERNTVGVPAGGWVTIRFLADNPGVWFMHCHIEEDTSWGLKMAWIVEDGKLPNQKLPPPPSDYPKC